MKKNCFVKEKGKKESLLSRAASSTAKKQRNKRWVCGWEPEFMPEFFGAAYQPLKGWRPELDFRIAPVSLQNRANKIQIHNEQKDERSVATGDAMKYNRLLNRNYK